MSLRATLASGSSFAHLLGRKKSIKAAKADEMDDDEDAKKAKKAKRADDDGGDLDDVDDNEDEKKEKLDDIVDDSTDDDGLADDDEDAEDEDKAKKARKAKKAKAASDDDEDDDKKGSDAKKARTARLTERARCKAIFASQFAAGRPHVAAKLAFDTNMSAKDAIGVLAATAAEDDAAPEPKKAKGSDLRSRMSVQENPDVGSDGGSAKPASGPAAFAAAVLRADAWRRNEKV